MSLHSCSNKAKIISHQWLPHSDLHSYLLGDHEDDDDQPNNNPPGRHNNNRIPGLGEGLHAAHQAILQQGGPVGFQSYHRPVNFPLKVTLNIMVIHIKCSYPVSVEACGAINVSCSIDVFFCVFLVVKIILLVVFMCVTLLLASLLCLTLPGKLWPQAGVLCILPLLFPVLSLSLHLHSYLSSSSSLPVCAGRWLMSFWMGSAMVHELYTAASGLYVCWLSIRAATVMLSWMPQGRNVIMIKVQEWTLMVMWMSL